MSVDFLLTMIQSSLLLAFVWGVGSLFQRTRPCLSVRLLGIGLIASSLIVVVGHCGIPRPIQLTSTWITGLEPSASECVDVPISNSAVNPLSANESIDSRGSAAKFDAVHWLHQLRFGGVGETGRSIEARYPVFVEVLRWTALIIVGIAVLRIFLGSWSLIIMGRQSVLLPRHQWPSGASRVLSKLPNQRNVCIRIHAEIGSPCIHAFSPSTVFVPPEFFTWTKREVEVAFAHEMAHLERRDGLWRLASDCCLVLLAINPIAYLVRRKFVFAQELAADSRATELIGSVANYRQGLSSLVLKLDHKKRFGWEYGFGVGVSGFSSSLIRRITMLQNKKVSVSSGGHWVPLVTTVLLASIAMGMASWTVVADEPPRVASLPHKIVGDGLRDPSALPLFARSGEIPRFETTNSNGFLRLRVAEAAKHPALGMGVGYLSSDLNSMLKQDQAQSLDEFDLDVMEIDSIETNLELNLSRDESAAPEEDSNKISIEANAFRVLTPDAVNWQGLSEALDIDFHQLFGGSFSEEESDSLFEDLGRTNRLELVPNAKDVAPDSSVDPRLVRMWTLADGGVLTLATDVQFFSDMSESEEQVSAKSDSIPAQVHAFHELAEVISQVGVGIDFEPGSLDVEIKLVISGKADTDATQLSASIESARAELLTELRESDEPRTDKIDVVKSMKFTTTADPVLGPVVTSRFRIAPTQLF